MDDIALEIEKPIELGRLKSGGLPARMSAVASFTRKSTQKEFQL